MAEAALDSDFSDEEVSDIDAAFNKASNHVRTLTSKLNATQLLELYGLYKQGTEGKCNIPRPGFFNMQGRQKWDAWNALNDMPKDKAKQKYTELVQKFDPECSELSKSVPKETWVSVSKLQVDSEPELNVTKLTILEAARENMADLVTELIKKNPGCMSEIDDDGMTALHWAADRDATKALIAVLNGGLDVNAKDSSGQTALHYAASCGNVESVKILLDFGASMSIQDEDGLTVIDVASDEVKKLLPCS